MDLIPVDHDPYNAPMSLIPVDHDPFAAAAKSGQTVQPSNVGADIAAMPGKVARTVSDLLGVTDAAKALRGEMTPEEAQTFALGAIPALVAGPESRVAEETAPLVETAAQKTIRAFHGSPYDFNQFDLSKIGTGEGAQAYGHGLYFAENPATAQQYRETLGRGDQIKVGDQVADKMYGDYYDQRARQWVQSAAKNPSGQGTLVDDAIARAQADLDYMNGARGGAQAADSAQKTLDRLQEWKQKGVSVANPGKTYEVNINADPEHFLDWDKPLSEQHPVVQEALGVTPEIKQSLSDYLAGKTQKSDYAPEVWEKMKLADDDLHGSSIVGRMTKYTYPIRDNPQSPWKAGGDTFEDSLAMVGGDKSRVLRLGNYDPAYSSQALRQAGIPGIKYLDQGSRGTGTGTSNYVVFNDKLIDIVKKYGLAGLVAGGAAHFTTTPVDHDPFE